MQRGLHQLRQLPVNEGKTGSETDREKHKDTTRETAQLERVLERHVTAQVETLGSVESLNWAAPSGKASIVVAHTVIYDFMLLEVVRR